MEKRGVSCIMHQSLPECSRNLKFLFLKINVVYVCLKYILDGAIFAITHAAPHLQTSCPLTNNRCVFQDSKLTIYSVPQ